MNIEIENIKDEFERISTQYNDKLLSYEQSEEQVKKVKENAELSLKNHKNKVISLNIGGEVFQTKLATLLSIENCLFQHFLTGDSMDLDKEIFIDRSPLVFSYILDFLRTKRINLIKLHHDWNYEDFLLEAAYYGIVPALEKEMGMILSASDNKPKIIGIWVSCVNSDSSTDLLNDLKDPNLKTGIITNANGWMILEFKDPFITKELKVGGYTGSSNWSNARGYGSYGQVLTSTDMTHWSHAGSLPWGFGDEMKTVKLKNNLAKYVKITSKYHLGIGHVDFN